MKLFAMLATLALATMVGLAIAGEDGVVEDFHLGWRRGAACPHCFGA
jgi:hypothetical protein